MGSMHHASNVRFWDIALRTLGRPSALFLRACIAVPSPDFWLSTVVAIHRKVVLCEPMLIDQESLNNELIHECGVGWWEAVVRTNSNRLMGWNIFKY